MYNLELATGASKVCLILQVIQIHSTIIYTDHFGV